MFIAKALVVTGAVGALALAAPPPAGGERTAVSRPVFQQVVTRLVQNGAPGALVVVRTPAGTRRAAAGLARRRPRVALRPRDRFRGASITKPFVATLVLQLVAEGRITLNDPVESRLPGLLPDGAEITIRQLLNHTSGVPDYSHDPGFGAAVIANPGRRWSPLELIGVANSHSLSFPPGTGWSYSNTNYVVLGLLVEAVTGMPLEHELRRRLLGPLGLRATSFPADAHIDGRHAHGYIGSATLPRLQARLMDVTETLDPSYSWAAGALISNGDDLARFFARLLGGHVLRPDLLAAMRTVAPGSTYGLGLDRVYTTCGPAFGHSGDGPGYRSVVYARPNGRRIAVVMVNIDATRVPWPELEAAADRALCG